MSQSLNSSVAATLRERAAFSAEASTALVENIVFCRAAGDHACGCEGPAARSFSQIRRQGLPSLRAELRVFSAGLMGLLAFGIVCLLSMFIHSCEGDYAHAKAPKFGTATNASALKMREPEPRRVTVSKPREEIGIDSRFDSLASAGADDIRHVAVPSTQLDFHSTNPDLPQ